MKKIMQNIIVAVSVLMASVVAGSLVDSGKEVKIMGDVGGNSG